MVESIDDDRRENVKIITRELLADYPRITLDRDTLGEPRVLGHRLTVAWMLDWIARMELPLAVEIQKHGPWELTDDDFKESLEFAADFFHRVFCSQDLFSDADLEEFPRDYTKDP